MSGSSPEPSTELGPGHYVASRMFSLRDSFPFEESGSLSQTSNPNHSESRDQDGCKFKASLGDYLKIKSRKGV